MASLWDLISMVTSTKNIKKISSPHPSTLENVLPGRDAHSQALRETSHHHHSMHEILLLILISCIADTNAILLHTVTDRDYVYGYTCVLRCVRLEGDCGKGPKTCKSEEASKWKFPGSVKREREEISRKGNFVEVQKASTWKLPGKFRKRAHGKFWEGSESEHLEISRKELLF